MISMLEDGQIPQQLPDQRLRSYLDDEADLRRNLLGLLAQLQSQADNIADREQTNVRIGQQDNGPSTYLDPLSQHPAEAPFLFPLTGVNKPSLKPVTCIFGVMKEGNLSFISQHFRWFEASHFLDALNSHVKSSMGLMYLTIKNWQPWFIGHLKSAVPNFPAQSLLNLGDNSATTMLPRMDRYLSEMSFVTDHIDIDTEHRGEVDGGLGIGPARTLSRPLVVVSQHHSDIVSKIAGHYIQVKNGQVSHVRWERMRANQTWVYLDLGALFTNWAKVWGAVKDNVKQNTAILHNERKKRRIIARTRKLHLDNIVTINLREQLRTHRASLKVVTQRTTEPSELQYWQSSEILATRLDDLSQMLDYHDLAATSLLDQQQSLISLTSTLESDSQGHSFATLSTLASIFLPLGFVSSVFGINTMTVSPKYFPAAAVPFLLLTLTIVYIADRIMKAAHEPRLKPHSRSTDIEKLSVRQSPTTFDYPDLQGSGRSWTATSGNLFRTFLPTHTSGQQTRPKTSRGKAVDTTENATRPPTVRISQTAPRISFQAAQLSLVPTENTPPELPFGFPVPSERLTSQDDKSMSRGRPPVSFTTTNTEPRVPDIEISNPLWPPTTFPNFDSFESPTSTSREVFAPLASIPSRTSSLRQLSPNVGIRQASPVRQSRVPSPSLKEEDITDIPTTAMMVDVLENTFRSLSKKVSRQHIGHQLVRTTGADVGEQRIIGDDLKEYDKEVSKLKMDEDEDVDTTRSSAEYSDQGQIYYADIERRQAEVDDNNHEVEFPELSRTLTEHLARSGSASSTILLGRSGSASSTILLGQGFGDQKLVLEALHTSGYVERLVSRFEGVGEAIAARPLVDPAPYSPEEYAQESEEERQAPRLGFAFEQREILASSSVDVELYDAEDNDFHRGFRTSPRAIVHSNSGSVRSGPRSQNSREFLSPSPPTPPPPPRSPARSTTSLLLSPEIGSSPPSSLPQKQKQKQKEKTTERTPSQASSTPSTSSNETAVTAHTSTQPLPFIAHANNSTASLEQEEMLYDADGFFRSPASPSPSPSPPDEHAEHPDGLKEQRMLDLLEEEQDGTPHRDQREEYFEEIERERRSEDGREGLSAISERTEDEGVGGEDGFSGGGSGVGFVGLGRRERDVMEDYTGDFTERDTTEDESEERDSSEIGAGSDGDGEGGMIEEMEGGGGYTKGFLDTIPE